MTARIFKVDGVVTEPRMGKYSPLNFVSNPDGGSPLVAGWLLGEDYHVGAPSEGAPLTDLSGNGHTLIRTGTNANAGVKAKHAIGNGNDYWTTSFTMDDVAAAGNPGEICLMALAIAPVISGESYSFANSAANAGAFGNRSVALLATSAFDTSLTQNDGAAATNRNFGNPVTADRATEYFVWGGNFKINALAAYVENSRAVPVPYTVSALAPTGIGAVGGGALRIVNSNVNTLSLRQAAMLVFNRNLSPAEMQKVFLGLKAILAKYGVTV